MRGRGKSGARRQVDRVDRSGSGGVMRVVVMGAGHAGRLTDTCRSGGVVRMVVVGAGHADSQIVRQSEPHTM